MAGLAFLGLTLFLALFEPGLPYTIKRAPAGLDSPAFLRMLSALVGAPFHHGTRIEVLTNGEVYYEAELEAMAAARHSIQLEAYIFRKGSVTRRFLGVMIERARAGVQVDLVLDAIGSFTSWPSYFDELRAAGGRVHWYHPLRWPTLHRVNNRTHRELILIDGRLAFVGGAGFGDQWRHDRGRRQAALARHDVPRRGRRGPQPASDLRGKLDRGLRRDPDSRALFPGLPAAGRRQRHRRDQLADDRPLDQGARAVPDAAGVRPPQHPHHHPLLPARPQRARRGRARDRARRQRGDRDSRPPHRPALLTRRSSRRLYGSLLRAGARIYEYQPAMLHTKSLVVDELWSVVGSTNFDNRRFGLNDEVNLAACDAQLAERLLLDFAKDLAESRPVTYDDWLRRSWLERGRGWLGTLLERQQ